MNSLWGIIAHIIEKTGWSWGCVLNETSWINIRMMLADSPRYVTGKKDSDKQVITEATDDDLKDLMI